MIHVRHGKGAKDRYVPLPQRPLGLLLQYWRTHRNPVWLFPAEGRQHLDLAKSTEPMSKRSVQDAFRAALKQSRLNKRASVHTLRLSWATHLLEAGVNLRLIQEWLGQRPTKLRWLGVQLIRKVGPAPFFQIPQI